MGLGEGRVGVVGGRERGAGEGGKAEEEGGRGGGEVM